MHKHLQYQALILCLETPDIDTLMTSSSLVIQTELFAFTLAMYNASTPPEIQINKQAILLKLITEREIIERVIPEKVTLKIGRQVKSPQEKLLSQLGGTEEAQDTVRQRADSTPTAFANSAPSSPEKAGPASSNKNTEPVWFKSKVVSRSHAEIWLKDGQIYLRDAGSSSGTFLNKLRLSPANKISRPYPLKEGDVIQLGVDYQGRTEEIYKAVEIKVSLETSESHARKQLQILNRFKNALVLLLIAANPYSTQKEHDHKNDTSVDCCICISAIGPFQGLFIAPCSHCFHYKCIQHILRESIMFPCPVCRQVANLDASVSMESLFERPDTSLLRKSNSSLALGDLEADLSSQMARPLFGLELANRVEIDHNAPITASHDGINIIPDVEHKMEIDEAVLD
ncbi:hypothetical protein HDV01_006476 [Terramyces sp. JEL0728]|nr:hypothetical protein HDV01_006476 [Terramyces sp. JEL0728]